MSNVRCHKCILALSIAPIRRRNVTSDSTFLGSVLELLSGIGALRTRKMFGGTYVYCDDLFIATVHDDTLYFKANAFTAPDFVAKGLPAFSYPKEGGVATLQYYQAPPEVFSGRSEMRPWAAKALLAAKQDAASKSRKTVRSSKASAARHKVESKPPP
jgi:DNA transformation protein and related proteins